MAGSDGDPRRIGLGICGLGRAFSLMLPTFARDVRVRPVAATTPGRAARDRFEREFEAPTYDDLESLCRDPAVEAVYIASPHQFHREHAEIAARAGKHVLVDKPLALTLEDAEGMVMAAREAGVHLIVGPSHSFDEPVALVHRLIASGEVGRVRMINALNFTDFLFRPRRPEELDPATGGGVLSSQAIHQIDVVRRLGGGLVRSVTAAIGDWDAARPTEGAYSALMRFEDGAFASLTYSGYARYDSDELMDWVGELGHAKDPRAYGKARTALAEIVDEEAETAAKRRRNYGFPDSKPDLDGPFPQAHEHFGFVVVSCECADLRLTPRGVWIMGDREKRFVDAGPPDIPRRGVMDALYEAAVFGREPLQSGEWGLASLEACLAIRQSAHEGRTIELRRQIAARPPQGAREGET